jgi:spermidine synthase
MDLDIPARLDDKRIPTVYVANYFHGDVSAERIDQANGFLDKKTPKNKELSPYLLRLMMDQWFAKHQSSPKGFAAGVVILICCIAFTLKRKEFVLFTTGYAVMGAEILTILSVQIFLGFIYSKIGLVVTVFMAGLFPGAWVGRLCRENRRGFLMAGDAALIVLLVIFAMALQFGEAGLPMIFFLVFGLLVSFCCGFQFPLVFSFQGSTPAGAVGAFSSDLMGAAFGTLLTGVFFIPFFGLMAAAWTLIGLKAASFLILSVKVHENNYPA